MSTSVLVSYATHYGSTHEVAEVITKTLLEGGLAVDLQLLRDVRTLDGYDVIVIGAPLFMFRWHKDALRFLKRYQNQLLKRQVAVFVLGPVHEPHDEQEWQDSWSQINKELAKYPWFIPVSLEMFGGKYDPEMLGFPIKLFAGEAPPSDLRDWIAIRTWTNDLAEKFLSASI